jgi:hypothetical protein
MPSPLITGEYARLNAALHASNPRYGASSARWADRLRALVAQLGSSDVLDYGCGKQCLQGAVPELALKHYDPGIAGLDGPPEPADIVFCTDVLEHVEPELLDNVLDHLAALTRKLGFFTIATRPAVKVLADGRNAHLIQQPLAWWMKRLEARFDILECTDFGGEEFSVLVRPKAQPARVV